jgi:hypothetical protein
MTLSAVLEVAIGLALVYYALGLIVNLIVGTIKDVLDMRAEALETVLEQFLRTRGNVLFTRFDKNALIQNLKPIIGKPFQLVNRTAMKASEIPDSTFSLALLDVLSSTDLVLNGLRSVINLFIAEQTDETTRDILSNVLEFEDEDLVAGLRGVVDKIPDQATKQKLEEWVTLLLGASEDQLAVVRTGIKGLPEGKAKDALLGLIELSVKDVQEAQARLQTWYNDMMKNVSLLFTQKVRIWVIGVSLAVTFIVGADSIYIAQTLWEQPTRRAAVAAAVPDFVEAFGPGEITQEEMVGLTAKEKLEVIQGRVDDVNKVLGSLGELDAPVTWWQSPPPKDLSEWLLKIIGLLITGAATSQGSSFWYDILKKINPQSRAEKTSS